MADGSQVGVRWTVGDVSLRGFEALRLSVWGAWRLFGPGGAYVIRVNSISLDEARRRTGAVPAPVVWRSADRGDLSPFLSRSIGSGMAEGVAWKLAPVRLFQNRCELTLDNDCILWDMPETIARWLAAEDPDRCVLAEDVEACFGQFAGLCGPEPRNAGIRGLPPGFAFGRALQEVLETTPVHLDSELDEQGLQVAALSRRRAPLCVTLDEVSICSPFPPRRPRLGRCGAHFVGLNVTHLPWNCGDRSAVESIAENWERHRRGLYRAVGLSLPGGAPARAQSGVGAAAGPAATAGRPPR